MTEPRIQATLAAIQGVLSVLVLLDVVQLTAEQIAGIITACTGLMLAVRAWFSPAVPVVGKE